MRPPSAEEIERVKQALKDLKTPLKLAQSFWASACIVSRYAQEHPNITPEEALVAVFEDALQSLKTERAEILRERFFNEKSFAEAELRLRRPEKTLMRQQKDAISDLTYLLIQKEQTCKNNTDNENRDTTNVINIPIQPIKKHTSKRILLYIIMMSIVIIAALSLRRYLNIDTARQPCEALYSSNIEGMYWPKEDVSVFNTVSTNLSLPNNKVRFIVPEKSQGIWFSYYSTEQNPATGLGYFDNKILTICKLPEEISRKNISALARDLSGNIWISIDKSGVAQYDGNQWTLFNTRSGNLPYDEVYCFSIDTIGHVWAGTRDFGVMEYDGVKWSSRYTSEDRTIQYNDVHALLFSGADMFVGHAYHGISRYNIQTKTLQYYDTNTPGFGGLQIRSIVALTIGDTTSIWVGTVDKGVMRFENEQWETYDIEDGLPSNTVRQLGIDKDKRLWAATEKGVAYFDVLGKIWKQVNHIDTHSIAFGETPQSDCQTCAFSSDDVWTGTAEGIAHGKLPTRDNQYTFKDICFKPLNRQRKDVCIKLDNEMNKDSIIAEYPEPLMPGEKFRTYITATPNVTQVFTDGDLLRNTDDTLFGTWPHMAVKKMTPAGEVHTFENEQNPFVAPELLADAQEKTYSSTWRMWLRGRYTGPELRIVFRVRKT